MKITTQDLHYEAYQNTEYAETRLDNGLSVLVQKTNGYFLVNLLYDDYIVILENVFRQEDTILCEDEQQLQDALDTAQTINLQDYQMDKADTEIVIPKKKRL